jgi:hypothetical protein
MTDSIAQFSKLSLGTMSFSSPSVRFEQDLGRDSERTSKLDDSNSDSQSDSTPSVRGDEEPEDQNLVRSPSKLIYTLDGVSPEIRAGALDAFGDPPRLTLQYCRLRDSVYAFQMTELVHRSVRIGGPGSRFPTPQCSCHPEGSPSSTPPCKHILWLMDRIVKQTHYGQDPKTPIPLTRNGIPEPLSDSFRSIAAFHLDILASTLHSTTTTPDAPRDALVNLSSTRSREARELLAAVSNCIPEEYRPDIFGNMRTGSNQVEKRHDLDYTVARMLFTNDEFFDYFRASARKTVGYLSRNL